MATSDPGISMNKLIHRAVLRDLAVSGAPSTAFPDGTGAAAALERAWANLNAELTDHHLGEHERVAGTGRDRDREATIEAFDAEHEAITAASRPRDSPWAGWSGRPLDVDASFVAMKRLEITTVTHLDHEERQNEETLAERQVTRRSRTWAGSQPPMGPVKAGAFFAWIQDGATPEETDAPRADVPGPVVKALAGIFGVATVAGRGRVATTNWRRPLGGRVVPDYRSEPVRDDPPGWRGLGGPHGDVIVRGASPPGVPAWTNRRHEG